MPTPSPLASGLAALDAVIERADAAKAKAPAPIYSIEQPQVDELRRVLRAAASSHAQAAAEMLPADNARVAPSYVADAAADELRQALAALEAHDGLSRLDKLAD